MKIHNAQIEVWDGLSFQLFDFHQAETQESLGMVIREYVSAMGMSWCTGIGFDEVAFD